MTLVPTIHQIMLQLPVPLSMPRIRFIRSCSSSLAPTTLYQLERAFNAPVLEAYAMTEGAHQLTSNPIPTNKQPRKPGSVGIPQGPKVIVVSLDRDIPCSVNQPGQVCVR